MKQNSEVSIEKRILSNNTKIRFFNPASGEIETEAVYGERWLCWAYENPVGRLAVTALLQRALFSQWYGWRMDRPASVQLIYPFIDKYGVDPDDFAVPVESFSSFNAFFYRQLKSQARPVDAEPDSVVFPADGRHLAIPQLDKSDIFYAKGQRFDLRSFIGDSALAERFIGGSLLISRLCPVDYHRFHFPVSARAEKPKSLPGALRSVSPIALRRSLSILWQNRRQRTLLNLPNGNSVLMMEIGATCVGRIHQTYNAASEVQKGSEKGYFAFGGSCVATVFQPGTISFTPSLLEYSAKGIETYARVGQVAGGLIAGESS